MVVVMMSPNGFLETQEKDVKAELRSTYIIEFDIQIKDKKQHRNDFCFRPSRR